MMDGRTASERKQSISRTYVACIPCRSRKVKCHIKAEPPCVKCEREHRECVFDIKERSKKHREPPKWAIKHAAQRSASTSTVPEHLGQSVPSVQQQSLPTSMSPLSHVSPSTAVSHDESPFCVQIQGAHQQASETRSAENDATPAPSTIASEGPSFTDRVVSSTVSGPKDALAILFDAAHAIYGNHANGPNTSSPHPRLEFHKNTIPSICQLSCPQEEILDLWDRFRFVRQGWFTAQEAVTYVDLFYRHFAPLSLAVPELFREHVNHRLLICEEPMLCCTILMISSRYFSLPGAGGQSRSQFIHQRLWQYCELLIRRVTCGQEKYSTAKTRVLGTIESLLIISDWHPRSIHFPPDTEGWGWDSMLISQEPDRRNRTQKNDETPLSRWHEDVFEPSKRAERMSWMLLGCAVNLGYELNVFSGAHPKTIPNQADEQSRSLRLQKLLYVHVTQMANRLGYGSMLPDSLGSATVTVPTTSTFSNAWDSCSDLWISLTRLTKTASTMFFPSPEYTKQIVLSGQYEMILQQFSSSLTNWWDKFSPRARDLPHAVSGFLTIEYCYTKAYTNALSVQAIVEQALSRGVQTISDCQNGVLKNCYRSNDIYFIQEVQSACHKILEIAIDLASNGTLRYAPSRITSYITCSSVILLKVAIVCKVACVDADRTKDIQAIEKAIVAFRSSAIDDMDLACRYATLLEGHLTKLRTWFIPSRPSGTVSSHTTPSDGPLQLGRVEDYPFLGDTANDMNYVMGRTADADWWTLPFDPSLCPFPSSEYPPFTLGFHADSLDFLWNMADTGVHE